MKHLATLILSVFLLSGHCLWAEAGKDGAQDPRFVGTWKCLSEFKIVMFHTALANGGFVRSHYSHGKLLTRARGSWYVKDGSFHIVLERQSGLADPNSLVDKHSEFVQPILEVGDGSYVVHEGSTLHELRWTRISGGPSSGLNTSTP